MLRSARTTGDGLNGRVPAARKNSSSVMPERIRGKSTAHTSWSGTPARKACTRSGSRSNSCVEIRGIECLTGFAPGASQKAHQHRGIEVEHLGPRELAVGHAIEPENRAVEAGADGTASPLSPEDHDLVVAGCHDARVHPPFGLGGLEWKPCLGPARAIALQSPGDAAVWK